MRNDLSPSDFAGLEHQSKWFDERYSFIGDKRVSRHEQHEEGDIIRGLRWAVVAMILVVASVSAFAWGMS